MSIKSDLENFYTQYAKHYYQTRKKYRGEGQCFLKAIREMGLEKPRILELGCGGGRFLNFLKQTYEGEFDYVGIDLSEGLLALAQKDNPDAEFIHADMCQISTLFSPESFDIIVACASFQHLPNPEERQEVIDACYQLLKYDGILMMTNWAFSLWFLKKHWQIFIKSGLWYLLSFGKQSWRDVFVPWQSGKQKELRYYHLFSLEELRNFLRLGGFTLLQMFYLDKQGQQKQHWKKANNSRFLAKKTIFSF